MSRPLISVLVPVYNAAAYLREAVDSILAQTLEDFEFIVVNDGSTDTSPAILDAAAIGDARLKVLHLRQNSGIVAALNIGLQQSVGKYIARMDSDDISLPERFAKQVSFMEANPEVGICGTWVTKTMPDFSWQPPPDHAAIGARMLFGSPLVHPTVMMRSEVLRRYNLRYDARFLHAEDYDLWNRAFPFTRLANIPEILLHYRVHAQNTFQLHRGSQATARREIYRRLLASLNIVPSRQEIYMHDYVGMKQRLTIPGYMGYVRRWLDKIERANRKQGIFDHAALKTEIENRWQFISTAPLSMPVVLPFALKQFIRRVKEKYFGARKADKD